MARFGGAAGLSSRVEKHVGPASKEACSSLGAHRADVHRRPPLPLHVYTINVGRRKIAGAFLDADTEEQKGRRGARRIGLQMYRERAWLNTVAALVAGYTPLGRIKRPASGLEQLRRMQKRCIRCVWNFRNSDRCRNFWRPLLLDRLRFCGLMCFCVHE